MRVTTITHSFVCVTRVIAYVSAAVSFGKRNRRRSLGPSGSEERRDEEWRSRERGGKGTRCVKYTHSVVTRCEHVCLETDQMRKPTGRKRPRMCADQDPPPPPPLRPGREICVPTLPILLDADVRISGRKSAAIALYRLDSAGVVAERRKQKANHDTGEVATTLRVAPPPSFGSRS